MRTTSMFSVRGFEFFITGMVVVGGITALRMLVAYPIARLSGPVRFDAPQGGTSLSVILALAFGASWPTFGFFVPKGDIWRDGEFNPYNGLQSFATWMSIVLSYVAASIFYPDGRRPGAEIQQGPVRHWSGCERCDDRHFLTAPRAWFRSEPSAIFVATAALAALLSNPGLMHGAFGFAVP